MSDVTTIVDPNEVERYREHVETTIRYGIDEATRLKEWEETGPVPGAEFVAEMKDHIAQGEMADKVEYLGPRDLPDDPNPEVEFRGPREVMVYLAEAMAYDAGEKIEATAENLTGENVAAIKNHVSSLEWWVAEIESLRQEVAA